MTGKSDNNGKCQFPLHLRDNLRVNKLNVLNKGRIVERDVPRVLKLESYMGFVAQLKAYPDDQLKMLQRFLDFLLSGSHSVEQLWAIGRSYHTLKEMDMHRELLSPLVVFQIRGSVSATGGHEPERILREEMTRWGLIPDIDFNAADVGVSELLNDRGGSGGSKTRKFDFALPYKTPGWNPRILIQCQFYAGYSGIVSHKSVDQTPTGRNAASEAFTKAGYPVPYFIEYVDGAGYFASLNGDLRHLLEIDDTKSLTTMSR